MSNIKKIIGVVLALVMALSVATVAFAAEAPAYTVAFTVVDNKTTINEGESATVEVKLTTNYYVSAMSIPVFFDNSKVDVVATTELNSEHAKIATETSADVDKYFENSGHTKADYGIRALIYIAPYGTEITSYTGDKANTTVMTLTVTAKAGVSGAVVLECLKGTVKTNANPAGTLYVAKNSNNDSIKVDSKAEVVDAATIENATATINIGSAAQPELILTATGEGYGTVIRNDLCTTNYAGCVFGIDTLNGEAIEKYVTATNGSIEVVPNSESGKYATGATIVLKDKAGVPVKTYVFISFGDVNGDGRLDGTDAVAVEMHDGWIEMLEEDSPYFYSADVNYDGRVDGTDAVAIEMHDGWVEMLDSQSVIAAGFDSAWERK